ncbi:cation diffusion facilitator family transporter [Paenibacillus sp. y28]|uniref:cation diffusion facilitator family transporter n=1 Tax=Paenibacillus sp. y28 TaxID=3129110 RepID=UPI003019D88D
MCRANKTEEVQRTVDVYNNIKESEKGAWLSIGAYLVLAALKLASGWYFASEALTADGWNNTSDIVVSLAVLVGLRLSRKPPDDDHPYGHFRAETIAALVASILMITVGLQVLYQAVTSLLSPEKAAAPDMPAAWIALGCSVIMFFVYAYNMRLARKVDSQALRAAAADNRSDALVSLGAFGGISVSRFGLQWLDTLTALIIGILICKTAIDIFRETSHSLTDGFDETRLDEFRDTILHIEGVDEIKDLRARQHGNQVLLDVVVCVDYRLNVWESHEICEEIEEKMMKVHQIHFVHVHIEPVDTPEQPAAKVVN